MSKRYPVNSLMDLDPLLMGAGPLAPGYLRACGVYIEQAREENTAALQSLIEEGRYVCADAARIGEDVALCRLTGLFNALGAIVETTEILNDAERALADTLAECDEQEGEENDGE